MIHVLVTTCDKYAPIITKWLTYFYRTWTLPHKLTVVGVTPGSIRAPIAMRYKPISAIYLGRDNGWAANLLRYLDTIENEPFLMMMDDHILIPHEINNDLIREAREIISRTDVGCVRLVPWPGPTLPYIRASSLEFDYETDNFGEIDKTLEYAISLQASFWKPQTLRDLLDASWSPWQIELEGSKRAAAYPMKFIGCKVTALSYKDYYMRGGARPEHAQWVEDHLYERE